MKESVLATRIGQRLQDLRKRRGLTQERAAEATGLASNYVSEVERGAKLPSLPTLAALAAAYDVSLSAALLGVDRPPPRRFARLEDAIAGMPKPDQERVLDVVRAALELTSARDK